MTFREVVVYAKGPTVYQVVCTGLTVHSGSFLSVRLPLSSRGILVADRTQNSVVMWRVTKADSDLVLEIDVPSRTPPAVVSVSFFASFVFLRGELFCSLPRSFSLVSHAAVCGRQMRFVEVSRSDSATKLYRVTLAAAVNPTFVVVAAFCLLVAATLFSAWLFSSYS